MSSRRYAVAILILHCLCQAVRSAAASAMVSVVPVSLSFNTQTVQTQSVAEPVTLTNIGSTTLTVNGFNITAAEFEVTSAPAFPLRLAPGSSATLTVVFSPDGARSFTGELSFSTNSIVGAPSVSLSGTGSFSPTIANVTPASLSYGNQAVGVVTCSQTVTVSNGGSTTFTVTGASALSPFAVTGFSPTRLSPGQQVSFGVNFSPTAAATFNGSLEVLTDTLAPIPELLSGTGVQASAPGTVPLIDMGQHQTYLGFDGGLFDNGCNSPPTDHDTVGRARAALVTPLDQNGNPNLRGKIVLLSIGMSNAALEWCGNANATIPGCPVPVSPSFMIQAENSLAVNHQTLVILDGAAGGQEASKWISPTDTNYDLIASRVLAAAGLTENQVQAVWLKDADGGPTVSLPASNADAYTLETYMGDAIRAMKVRYPNLRIVFLSSRIYGGYATVNLNPEPYAYESGYSVKWLVRAQIEQMRHGGVIQDQHAGDLNYNTVAPWIVWGPYLWANGANPRSDGLVWLLSDFQSDGTHPDSSGIQKVGSLLLNYFLDSPYSPWFLAPEHAKKTQP